MYPIRFINALYSKSGQILLSLFLESLHIQAEDTCSSSKHLKGQPVEHCNAVENRTQVDLGLLPPL